MLHVDVGVSVELAMRERSMLRRPVRLGTPVLRGQRLLQRTLLHSRGPERESVEFQRPLHGVHRRCRSLKWISTGATERLARPRRAIFIDGRYQVLSLLGEGAVYRVLGPEAPMLLATIARLLNTVPLRTAPPPLIGARL
jgi:hypothetical protein